MYRLHYQSNANGKCLENGWSMNQGLPRKVDDQVNIEFMKG